MAASSSSDLLKDRAFVWDPNNISTVKIDDDEYYHPYPSKPNASPAWKFFRCKTGTDYSTEQPIFCLRCCKRMRAKPGDQSKMHFYSLKWKQGYTTSHLMGHVNQKHQADMQQIEQAKVLHATQGAGISVRTEETKERSSAQFFQGQRTISKEQQKSMTRDLVRHIVFEDKEPCSIVERPGFQKLVKALCPAYRLPHRTHVTEVADEIAEQCQLKVKAILKQHIETGGTVCLAADAWTKRRRKFIATVAYFIVKWRLMRVVKSCRAVPMGQATGEVRTCSTNLDFGALCSMNLRYVRAACLPPGWALEGHNISRIWNGARQMGGQCSGRHCLGRPRWLQGLGATFEITSPSRPPLFDRG
jgi:hypothetical protein